MAHQLAAWNVPSRKCYHTRAPPHSVAHACIQPPPLPLPPDCATHARPLQPAALASVPFGIVLGRVRVESSRGNISSCELMGHMPMDFKWAVPSFRHSLRPPAAADPIIVPPLRLLSSAPDTIRSALLLIYYASIRVTTGESTSLLRRVRRRGPP